MSRLVEWRGLYWGREFFEPPLDLPPGTCPRCGDLGVVPERLDEERHDVAVPCPQCRTWCKTCRDWVRRANHNHNCEAKP